MMYSKGFKNNICLNCEIVLLIKFWVVLYEVFFERYYKGIGCVLGDDNWLGKKVYFNFLLDVEVEVDFFLIEVMKVVEEVVDKIILIFNIKVEDFVSFFIIFGWNFYFEMYVNVDLSGYDEVLFWCQYVKIGSFFIMYGILVWIVFGFNYGLLKSYVESFLMQDGLFWYVVSSVVFYKGDVILDDVKVNCDNCFQLFMFGESNFVLVYLIEELGIVKMFVLYFVFNCEEMRDQIGYCICKYVSFDMVQNVWGKVELIIGCIIYCGVEVYLNYLEVYYMKNGNVIGKVV